MERKTQFLVPDGIDQEGNVVQRHDATREQRYACPSCGEPLILRAGDMRAQHFAHFGEGSCSAEVVLLAVAKRLLVRTVQIWRLGKGPAPRIEPECTHCQRPHWHRLPDKVLGAALDHQLPSGRIATPFTATGISMQSQEVRSLQVVNRQALAKTQKTEGSPVSRQSAQEAPRAPQRPRVHGTQHNLMTERAWGLISA